jgi:hypothetical protein
VSGQQGVAPDRDHGPPAAGGPAPVTEAESAATAWTAPVSFGTSDADGQPAADVVATAGADDYRMSAAFIEASARQIYAAWATACYGNEAQLTALARPGGREQLLRPELNLRRGRVIIKSLRIRTMLIRTVRIRPGEFVAAADCDGLRYVEDAVSGAVVQGDQAAEHAFVQQMRAVLDGGSGPWPWQLESAWAFLLTRSLGPQFVTRAGADGELREQAGDPAEPEAGDRRPRRFLIRADWVVHDERRRGQVQLVTEQDTAPGEREAGLLAGPAVDADVARALGKGQWLADVPWVEVTELPG